MKNNRLTKDDIAKLRMACYRIRSHASMDNSSFSIDANIDKITKQRLAPYMKWFECISYSIDDILDGEKVEWYRLR